MEINKEYIKYGIKRGIALTIFIIGIFSLIFIFINNILAIVSGHTVPVFITALVMLITSFSFYNYFFILSKKNYINTEQPQSSKIIQINKDVHYYIIKSIAILGTIILLLDVISLGIFKYDFFFISSLFVISFIGGIGLFYFKKWGYFMFPIYWVVTIILFSFNFLSNKISFSRIPVLTLFVLLVELTVLVYLFSQREKFKI